MLAGSAVVGVIFLVLALVKAVRKVVFIGLLVAGVLFAFSWVNANFTSSGDLKSQLTFPNVIAQVQDSLSGAGKAVESVKGAVDSASTGLGKLNSNLPTSGTGSNSTQIPDLSNSLNTVSSTLNSAGK